MKGVIIAIGHSDTNVKSIFFSDNGMCSNCKVYIKIKSYDGIISIMNKSRAHN